jgi:hypothetical protein
MFYYGSWEQPIVAKLILAKLNWKHIPADIYLYDAGLYNLRCLFIMTNV